ncbi:MAG: 3-dehydroquinate synthase [Microscillaceae bacterium]
MNAIHQEFTVAFRYTTYFTEDIFSLDNPLFYEVIVQDPTQERRKLLFVLDDGVHEHHPQLQAQILAYCKHYAEALDLRTVPVLVPGGEAAKNNFGLVEYLLKEMDEYGICRHSYLVAIGGGAVLDMAGFAAAIAHRGVRHIRIPTTVLAQNDSGVGVKNGVNFFDKKNFLGCFKPPQAVINDRAFLETLKMRDWRAGISEAVKVALIKSADFFAQIEAMHPQLLERDTEAMQSLIYHCAQLHMNHISGADPFESGSSRPLDFGHWAAHKLEQMTQYRIRHGEAVAIGMALDTVYAALQGLLSEAEAERVLQLLHQLGFQLYIPEMSQNLNEWPLAPSLLDGLEEFREHLGGKLTIMLLQTIGKGLEVHEIDTHKMQQAIGLLKEKEAAKWAALENVGE